MLVHGWGMNRAVWDGLAEGLGARVRLTRLELPGHGDTPFDPAAQRLGDWAETCLAGAPASAVWLGWSLGALVALQAARVAPTRVTGLILVGGTPRFVQAPDWPCALAAATLDQFRADLARDPTATLQRFLSLQVRGSAGAVETLRRLRRGLALRPAARAEALDAGLAMLAGSDLRGSLRDLACPSLWLLGERDTLVPRTLAERLPILGVRGPIRVLPGAGHAPFLSQPGEVRGAIEDFLASPTLGGGLP